MPVGDVTGLETVPIIWFCSSCDGLVEPADSGLICRLEHSVACSSRPSLDREAEREIASCVPTAGSIAGIHYCSSVQANFDRCHESVGVGRVKRVQQCVRDINRLSYS